MLSTSLCGCGLVVRGDESILLVAGRTRVPRDEASSALGMSLLMLPALDRGVFGVLATL